MKRAILTIILLAAACAGACGQAATGGGDAAQERRRDIRRLLELSRGAQLGAEIVRQGVESLRKQLDFLPDERREKVIKIFEEEMLKEFSEEKMAEAMAPIYEKHLTAEDVKALVAFYQTPLGQKMQNVLPSIVRESLALAPERTYAAGVRAQARASAEGLLDPSPPPPPPPMPRPQPGKPAPPEDRPN